jgi:hypothetical protein
MVSGTLMVAWVIVPLHQRYTAHAYPERLPLRGFQNRALPECERSRELEAKQPPAGMVATWPPRSKERIMQYVL